MNLFFLGKGNNVLSIIICTIIAEASRICKHFLTHGCKLGEKCRFLHCTPEELASQMAQDQGYSPHDDQDEQSAMDTGDTDHH